MAPGTLIQSTVESASTLIEVLDYNETSCSKSILNSPAEAKKYLESQETQSWLNFVGVSDTEKLKVLGEVFGIHSLVLEDINNKAESLEESVEKGVKNQDLANIQKIKRDTLLIRRLIAPVKELSQSMIKSESPLLLGSNTIYYKDLQDHALQALESLDTLRDFITSLREYCNSFSSTKLNEIMKVVTMVSTILIPITFLAGIEGMNFEHMPELAVSWSYPAAIGFMAIIVIAMPTYFKKENLL